MKKDWSAIKVTSLLYFIVLLIPVNYYFVKDSFDSMKNDPQTTRHLVFISAAVPTLHLNYNLDKKIEILENTRSSLKIIEKEFINFQPNKEFVSLFGADKMFELVTKTHEELSESLQNDAETKSAIEKMSVEIEAFSKTLQEMISYKIEIALDTLYISIVSTMLAIIVLVFALRAYIHIQFFRHSIYDHVTGLYNKKYFENHLSNSQELAIRHSRNLSLLVLSITNYNELNSSISKSDFEKYLKEFSTIFSHFFRHSDTVCRIENDTFASILPDASFENAQRLSLRLQRELVSKLSNNNIRMDICIGIAQCWDNSSASLLDEARKEMQNCSVIKLGSAL